MGSIFRFWSPLASTWLMMSLEGPFLTALIARMHEPKINLAAFGIAFTLAVFVEAPIMMLMAASTALVEDKLSYERLRNFMFWLCAGTTLIMLLLVFTPAFEFLALRLMDLPSNVASLSKQALLVALPFPTAVAYRRFYQGILIRYNKPKRVATGTLIRILTTLVIGFLLYNYFSFSGAIIGIAALSTAVTVEAAVSRRMARRLIWDLNEGHDDSLSYKAIISFYIPLALTPAIILCAQPVITFFMSQGRSAIDSLAVYPVVSSLIFVFRSASLAYHEVIIAKVGDDFEHLNELTRFAFYLASTLVFLLALLCFTPLSRIWFIHVAGLSPELADFSILPLQILFLLPVVATLLSWQRALLVKSRSTVSVTVASAVELVSIVGCMWLLVSYMDLVGVVAASIALLASRTLSSFSLIVPLASVLRSTRARLKAA